MRQSWQPICRSSARIGRPGRRRRLPPVTARPSARRSSATLARATFVHRLEGGRIADRRIGCRDGSGQALDQARDRGNGRQRCDHRCGRRAPGAAAVDGVIASAFGFSGQKCSACSTPWSTAKSTSGCRSARCEGQAPCGGRSRRSGRRPRSRGKPESGRSTSPTSSRWAGLKAVSSQAGNGLPPTDIFLSRPSSPTLRRGLVWPKKSSAPF